MDTSYKKCWSSFTFLFLHLLSLRKIGRTAVRFAYKMGLSIDTFLFLKNKEKI